MREFSRGCLCVRLFVCTLVFTSGATLILVGGKFLLNVNQKELTVQSHLYKTHLVRHFKL